MSFRIERSLFEFILMFSSWLSYQVVVYSLRHGYNIEVDKYNSVYKNHNRDDDSLLMIASRRKNNTVASILLKHGMDVDMQNIEGDTVLMDAVYYNNDILVKLLLKYCACVNIQNNDNYSALMFAKIPKIARLLLDCGAKTDIINKDNNDILAHYHLNKRFQLIELLAKLKIEL